MEPNDLAQLDRILAEWADWMSHEKVGRGYPSRAAGLSSGGSSESFEDLCERADKQRACAVNAVICSLPKSQGDAMRNVWLGESWVIEWPGLDYFYAQAVDRLPVELNRRGVVY